jgi:predicted nucleic acid-binding protein
MTLVDTNVLLDLLTSDPKWADWSIGQLDAAALRGPLAINDIVYAELSVRFAAFQRYRAVGGTRSGVLPDFFVGAHAAVLGCALLSRDAGRYGVWFPGIELVTA